MDPFLYNRPTIAEKPIRKIHNQYSRVIILGCTQDRNKEEEEGNILKLSAMVL